MHAQAAAAVRVDGTLAYGKNIVSASRHSTGRYCVRIDSDIDLSKEVVHVTPWSQYDRTFGLYTLHGHCGSQINTILVASNTSDTKSRADSPFYLSIPDQSGRRAPKCG